MKNNFDTDLLALITIVASTLLLGYIIGINSNYVTQKAVDKCVQEIRGE